MERLKGRLYLFGAFSLAGTSVIAARFVNDKLGTFTISAVSLFFALLFLLPLALRELVNTFSRLNAKDGMLLLLQALFGIFLFRMFLLFGLLHTSAAEAGILTGATPAVTVVLAMVLLKETANRTKLIGILSTVGGIFLIQGIFAAGGKFSADHMAGNILVLCAAVSESLFNILSRTAAVQTKLFSRSEPVHPLVQTTLVTAAALILCLIPSLFEDPVSALSAIGRREWLALIWYGPFVTALAFILWYAGIKRCPASTAAAFSGMMPFTALLLSVSILGEHAGWQQWTGGGLVMLGMVLIGGGGSQVRKPTEDHPKAGERAFKQIR